MRCTYFCGMQAVHELQKMSAYDVNIKQRRYNRLTVTTSTHREKPLFIYACTMVFYYSVLLGYKHGANIHVVGKKALGMTTN